MVPCPSFWAYFSSSSRMNSMCFGSPMSSPVHLESSVFLQITISFNPLLLLNQHPKQEGSWSPSYIFTPCMASLTQNATKGSCPMAEFIKGPFPLLLLAALRGRFLSLLPSCVISCCFLWGVSPGKISHPLTARRTLNVSKCTQCAFRTLCVQNLNRLHLTTHTSLATVSCSHFQPITGSFLQ